jgi:hypothetical protein
VRLLSRFSHRNRNPAERVGKKFPEEEATFSRLPAAAQEPIAASYSAPGALAEAAHKTGRAEVDFELREIDREEYERLTSLLLWFRSGPQNLKNRE